MGYFSRSIVGLASVVALAVGGASAFAATVNLTAVKDSSIFSDLTANANGAGMYIHSGSNSVGDVRRALVQFDLSSIPAGSTITAATLTLRMDDGGNSGPTETVELHKLTQSWSEGATVGANGGGHGSPALAGDVTWIRRTYNTSSWTNAGGTFSNTISASATVSNTPGTKTWTGAGVLADVQAWYANPANNFGWLLKGNEATDSTARRFSSRQNPTVSERPKLTITYTPPVTTGACCQISGTCSITNSAACPAPALDYQGNGTTCTPNPCFQPPGACCTGTGACTFTDLTSCNDDGGYFQGLLTSCTPNICPIHSGACCQNNATCTFIHQLNCVFGGGTYKGDDITCVVAACPWVLTPFVDSLPLPPTAVPTTGTAGGIAHYDMYIRQFSHQFHSEMPTTTVWGYNNSYPGPTIEARQGLQVTTTWHNDLRVNGPASALRTNHVLDVDTCLHGPDITGVLPVTVTHLHGAHLRPDSDGDPDTAFGPGLSSPLYIYPNNQHAATLWYHDHALGLTRLNVYMGLAGFYLIRDAVEDALSLPSGHNEIPLVIQDRSFEPSGALKYNSNTTFIDHFFGDFICVNGKVWPYMNVNRGKYRFRILNGSNTRTYTLRLSGPVVGLNFSVPSQVIGSDLGFLASPVSIGGGLGRSSNVTLMPGERADLIIDFSIYSAGDTITMQNLADVPFPGGGDGPDILNVMQFRVQAGTGDTGAIPSTLASVPRTPESDATVTRTFTLNKVTDLICNHDMWLINHLMWDDITEFPKIGDTEIWEWVNQSGVSHPMHIHLVEFQVLNRENFTVGGGGEIIPSGSPTLPPTVERGWKDTVQATPNQITRVIAKFSDYPGTFPFHCHILDHEDHEMMRQFTVGCKTLSVIGGVGAVQVSAGQPTNISAAGVGSPPFSYQWKRNNVALVNGPTGSGSVISGATTGSLTITNTKPTDAGSYNCLVTNPCGVSVSSSTRILTVFCAADFNHDGVRNVADIFAYLSAWFANNSSADFDGIGGITVSDIFVYLSAWFAGC